MKVPQHRIQRSSHCQRGARNSTGGKIRGGKFRGGKFRGGKFRGGKFRGEKFRGGKFRGTIRQLYRLGRTKSLRPKGLRQTCATAARREERPEPFVNLLRGNLVTAQ